MEPSIESGEGTPASPAQETAIPTAQTQETAIPVVPAQETAIPATPVQETATAAQGDVRTTQQFYEDMLKANPKTSETLQGLSRRESELSKQLDTSLDEVGTILGKMQDIPKYDVLGRMKMNSALKDAQSESGRISQQLQSIPGQMVKTRAPATEYTGDIASNETVVSAVNPARLQTLIEANTPLPGHEASVRIADLTPEQIQERKQALLSRKEALLSKEEAFRSKEKALSSKEDALLSGNIYRISAAEDHLSAAEGRLSAAEDLLSRRGALDPNRLPKDKRTLEEKEIDSAEEQLELESVAVEALTRNMLKEMGIENVSIGKGMKKWEIGNTEAVRVFAEYAYHMEATEFGIPTELLQEGSISIKTRIHELNKMPPSRELLGRIENLRYFAERVEKIENRARFSMAMWQMSNEVVSAVSGTELNPDKFLFDVGNARIHISEEDRYSRRTGRDFEAILKGMARYSPATGFASEVGLNILLTEYYDIPMRITEFAGHDSPEGLNREDVSKILAYLTALIEKDEDAFVKGRGFSGVDIALKVALREATQDRKEHTSLRDLVRNIRHDLYVGGYQSFGETYVGLENITGPYTSIVALAGGGPRLQQRFGGRRF